MKIPFKWFGVGEWYRQGYFSCLDMFTYDWLDSDYIYGSILRTEMEHSRKIRAYGAGMRKAWEERNEV